MRAHTRTQIRSAQAFEATFDSLFTVCQLEPGAVHMLPSNFPLLIFNLQDNEVDFLLVPQTLQPAGEYSPC